MTDDHPTPQPIEIVDDSAGHRWSAYVLCWLVGAVVTMIAQVGVGLFLLRAVANGGLFMGAPFVLGILHGLGPLVAVCLLPRRVVARGRGAWVAAGVPGPVIGQIAVTATLLRNVTESLDLIGVRLLPTDGGPFDPTLPAILAVLVVPTYVSAMITAHLVGWIRINRLRPPDPYAPL